MADRRLAGKFYVVTGGAQGVGEGVARCLARAGAAGVTLTDVQKDLGVAAAASIEAETGCPTLFVEADLADADACARVLPAHETRFGRVDGLVNAAGTTERSTWDDTTSDQWDRVMAINARAPLLLCQAACALMERDDTRGAIVNIGSVHAHGGMPKCVAYAASKGALLTLTKNLAFAKRDAGIRANYVALGWCATPREHAVMSEEHDDGEGWLAAADRSHPFGRIARPEDVGNYCVFLCSDEGRMLSGDCINLHEKFFGAWGGVH